MPARWRIAPQSAYTISKVDYTPGEVGGIFISRETGMPWMTRLRTRA
ncbi:MAG TPA: hypothetical protein VLW25_09850 [Bryobacteraceae bacterium]|nr:hypothetical protein [Bryobacteraceae bacterium]